jgi:serine acetyltransferase/acyl-CoA synthetase (AMP-forming)/AMP-acid ligase II
VSDAIVSGNPFAALPTVGVLATNSVGYVRQMLDNLEQGLISVPLGSAQDHDRLARTHTTDIQEPAPGGGWIDTPFRSRGGDDPAQISFTSGTQGTPKAVLLSHGNLHDVVTRVTQAMEITDAIREYIGVPVYHSFGYARARIVLNAGGAAYIPPAGFDLAEIRRMLADGEINAISAVPSLWRVFLSALDRFGPELAQVRWVEIGSQYMSAEEKAALRAALPNAKIVQHYGLTEASRTTLQRIHDAPAETLGSVGQVEGASEVRINQDGLIEIRGPHVALGIADGDTWHPLGSDAWLTTSDMGRIEDGRLYFEGRGDDVINCGGIKLSPDIMEAAIRQAIAETGADAGEFALLRRADPMRGEGIGLVVTPATHVTQARLIEEISAQAATLGVNARGAISVFAVDSLPRTDTGKLQRKLLAAAIEGQAAAGPAEDAPAVEGFAQLLERLLGQAIVRERSFADMDGDSLAHMQVTLALERALDVAPAGWEWQPLGQLIDRVDDAGDFQALMAQPGGAPPLPDGSRNMNPPGLSFRALVAEDFRTNDASLFHQGFLMLLVHRFGNRRMAVRAKLLRAPLTVIYRILNKLTQILFGMKLDYTVQVGRRVKLEHFGGMILGARAIGDDVVIRQNTTFGIRSIDDVNAKPIIGNAVDIGAGAVIVGNVTIGENSIIGANSVVFTNVPPNSVVMGVPGRVIGPNRRRNPSPLRPAAR